jgi:hypothetical protein
VCCYGQLSSVKSQVCGTVSSGGICETSRCGQQNVTEDATNRNSATDRISDRTGVQLQ